MNIFFKFRDSSPVSACSGVTGASAYFANSATFGVQSAVYTPTAIASLISGLPANVYSGISADAWRTQWIHLPVFDTAGDFTKTFSTSAYKTGNVLIIATDTDSTSSVTSAYADLTDEARTINTWLATQSIMAFTTGSTVVNTVLNEMQIHTDSPDASGVVADGSARTAILARYKLFDEYGNRSSVNPVISEAYNIFLNKYLNNMTTGAGSAFL